MKAFAFTALIAGLLVGGYYWIIYSKLSPDIHRKEKVLDKVPRKQGYKPYYFLLSGYRPHWLNRLMPLVAKNSDHQQGKAIDLFVIDIDGDYRFTDKDLTVLSKTVDAMDKITPDRRGSGALPEIVFPHDSFRCVG